MNRHPEGYPVKLVRDRIGEMLGGDGLVTYGELPKAEHVKRLRAKLIEEAAEYLTDPSIEELADVLSVVRALAVIDLDRSWWEVEDAEASKSDDRGGFLSGIAMYAIHPADKS